MRPSARGGDSSTAAAATVPIQSSLADWMTAIDIHSPAPAHDNGSGGGAAAPDAAAHTGAAGDLYRRHAELPCVSPSAARPSSRGASTRRPARPGSRGAAACFAGAFAPGGSGATDAANHDRLSLPQAMSPGSSLLRKSSSDGGLPSTSMLVPMATSASRTDRAALLRVEAELDKGVAALEAELNRSIRERSRQLIKASQEECAC
jgi:hypothetical protein